MQHSHEYFGYMQAYEKHGYHLLEGQGVECLLGNKIKPAMSGSLKTRFEQMKFLPLIQLHLLPTTA